jgi:hypothetical protein
MSKTDKKSKRWERMRTPTGVVKFAFLDKPSTKFKDEGEYSIVVTFDKATGGKLREELMKRAKAAHAECLKEDVKPVVRKARAEYDVVCGIKPELDDEGDKTGNYVASFSMPATREDKVTHKVSNRFVPQYDAKLHPLEGVSVGKGSKVRVSFDVAPYCVDGAKKAGVSLKLAGVQVLELVEFKGGGTSPSALGFDEEDGFDGSDAISEDDEPVESDDEDPSEEDDSNDDGEDTVEEDEKPAPKKAGKKPVAKPAKKPVKKGKKPADEDEDF